MTLSSLRSLLLTTLISFIAPIFVVVVSLAGLSAVSYVPAFDLAGKAIVGSMINFLAVFGGGCPFWGVLTIGSTFCVVGGLFNLYTLYRYQGLR